MKKKKNKILNKVFKIGTVLFAAKVIRDVVTYDDRKKKKEEEGIDTPDSPIDTAIGFVKDKLDGNKAPVPVVEENNQDAGETP